MYNIKSLTNSDNENHNDRVTVYIETVFIYY